VLNVDLLNHLKSGGGLVCGGVSQFDIGDLNPLQSRAARRSVHSGGGMFLSNFHFDMLSTRDSKMSGKFIIMIILNIISSMSTEMKLNYLVNGDKMKNIKVGDFMIDCYETQSQANCCGGATQKVVPLNKTPCILHDCVLSSLRVDLNIDLECFEKNMNYNDCLSIKALHIFADKEVNNKGHTPEIASLARDLYAIVQATKLLEKKVFKASKANKAWDKVRGMIDLTFATCNNKALEHNFDGKAMANRVNDIDVIGGGFGRPVKKGTKDPINLSESMLHLSYKLPKK
jgi:hypothetical protein